MASSQHPLQSGDGLQDSEKVPNGSTTDLEKGSILPPASEKPDVHTSDADADVEAQNNTRRSDERSVPDEFLVDWDGPDDPENPLNWPAGKKWLIISSMSLITFLTPLASSMLAPGVPVILQEFKNFNNMVATFVVSIYVLGFAFGPLLLAPLSELYGRMQIYHVTNIFFLLFTTLCAVSTSIEMLLASRFLAGFAGVATITIGAGSISDLMPSEKRAAAMAVWSLGPLLGPVIGPVCAGFVVQYLGWRWVFWIVLIVAGFSTIFAVFAQRETYAPVLLEKKAAKLRKSTGDMRYRSKLQKAGTPKELFLDAIVRPAKLFLFSPIVLLYTLHTSVVMGIMYLLFATFSFVFRDVYHFGSVGQGLSFVSMGVGNLIGLVYMASLSDRLLIKQRKARNGEPCPEDRLHPLLSIPPALIIPIGMFIYGWTTYYAVHWIVPMIGAALVGFGMIGLIMGAQVYLVEVHTEYAASVVAANAVLRSLVGALLPLAGLQLYDGLGLGWGNTLLGFMALVLAPVPFLMFKFGAKLRARMADRKF